MMSGVDRVAWSLIEARGQKGACMLLGVGGGGGAKRATRAHDLFGVNQLSPLSPLSPGTQPGTPMDSDLRSTILHQCRQIRLCRGAGEEVEHLLILISALGNL